MHNPSFKRPVDASLQPGRSPSPPGKFVEPLSPSRPRPIEPSFNYPAINNQINFHVRPEQPFTATPKTSGHKSSHQRTPSTIDTLAEVALSPAYQSSRSQASPTFHNGFVQTYAAPAGCAAHEPPHKRARSEVFPSPVVGHYASRPATSYIAQSHAPPSGAAYDSRVEEAALLLNFRTGGWPTGHVSLAPQPAQQTVVPAAPRPHANSFPQDSQHSRPLELSGQASLLPPFKPNDAASSRPPLSCPQQTLAGTNSSPNGAHPPLPPVFQDAAVSLHHGAHQADTEMPDAPLPTQTVLEGGTSRATSTDVVLSETSESAAKTKRGWPRGKSRASSGRKNVAEKAASKRAASRRKTPDLFKAAKQAAAVIGNDWNIGPDLNRRKSFNGQSTLDLGVSNAEARGKSVAADIPMIIRPTSPSKSQRRAKAAAAAAETICARCQTLRETSKTNPQVDEWISCNGCKNWFHVDCAGFRRATEVRDVDKYFCSPCEPTHGKTTYVRKSTRAHASVDYSELQRGVLKTSEEDMEHHYIQPIKDGTFQFDPETFPRMRPELVTKDFFAKSGIFTEPICIPAAWNPRPWLKRRKADDNGETQAEGDIAMCDKMPEDFEYDTVPDDGQDELDMVMPEDLTVRQVCNLVGPDTPLDVIDVKTQNSGAKWNLSRWADYYEEKGDDKPIRNVISLEVSHSKLGRLLRRPKIVRDIDLQDEVWPQEEKDKGKWPNVQYYCLMSVADSYTDFHIDFGGSSVYYHILKGKKTFFFIPPKAKHLKAYEEWNDSPQQNYTFLPNITKECYRVDLSEGDTMLIPSGWIHAVWTPETSLVIGGNFLTQMSFKNQFKVVEIEKANETPMKFRYPFFQRLMWYTAIKYMTDDPVPEEVERAYYEEGKRFDREAPIWADFDGEIAASDDRPGAKNARYYGQAELDGLPDLVNFIFRTVMLVMGRIEGISADRMKRVNASIPKGFGEPLKVAKTFALWCSWKRSEDLPAWSHPDAVLPNSKEGPPKKLSTRALKEMERKEAIAASRVAPDRQSERVRNATAALTMVATPSRAVATPERATSFTSSQQPSNGTYIHQQMSATTPAAAPPMALMMNRMPTQHLSTPKTSVLGPKRVACDACRKRRIRCKHKDFVLQATPDAGLNGLPQVNPGAPLAASQEIYDDIIVAPSKTNHHHNADQHGVHQSGISGNGLIPGTNAYVNANIPMAMNGVAIFGEAPKRGRTKACFECRKSKRRCVHDENGNVDPIKAAENPVPRGSNASKKRSSDEDGTPVPIKKKPRPNEPIENVPLPPEFQQPQSTHSQPTKPSHSTAETSSYPSHSYLTQHAHRSEDHSQHVQQYSEAPIDPHLVGYSEATEYNPYSSSSYSYSAERPGLYALPSLEQIANEVLDMNGRSHEDYQDDNVHVYNPNAIGGPTPHGLPSDPAKPDESVDSAISLGDGSETSSEIRQVHKHDEAPSNISATNIDDENVITGDAKTAREGDSLVLHHGLPTAHPSIESSGTDTAAPPPAVIPLTQTSPKSNVSSLPLYRPPAPLSASGSPEQSRRALFHSPVNPKRKRESFSEKGRPGSSKKARVLAGEDAKEPLPPIEDQESLELAKALQADDLGLRRRTSREN